MDNVHDNNFSILHWLGLTLVVLGHQYVLMGQNAPYVLDGVCHEMGLRILFIVSGYLVTKSFQHSDSNIQYLKKRVKRIFPPLILCVLGMALIIGPVFTTKGMHPYLRGAWRFIWKNILLCPSFSLPGVFVKNPASRALNGSLWSLPVEFFCYIVLMGIGACVKYIRKHSIAMSKVISILVFGFVYILYYLYCNGTISGNCVIWGTDWIYACSIFVYFAAGSIFAALSLESICNLAYGVLALMLYMVLPEPLYIMKPLLLSYFIISYALSSSNRLSHFLDRCNYYYAGYLWAFPIQQAVICLVMVKQSINVNPFIMFILCYAITILVAYITTKIVEKIETVSRIV